MPIFSAQGLSKTYGVKPLFAQIALTVLRAERVGIIGHNGSGKSTLLRVLAGIESADEGSVELRRGAQVMYLPQEPALLPTATARTLVSAGLAEWEVARARHEVVTNTLDQTGASAGLLEEQAALAETIERMGGWSRGHLVEEILHKVGIRELDREVGAMSGGEQRRIALAKVLVAEPDVALLDEPTNHLDADTIEWLEQYLVDRFAGAVVIVTHDRYVLESVANRIVELERGKLLEYTGGYSDYLEKKADLLAQSEREEKNRMGLLRRERAWLMRGARARTTKQKARVQRAEALISTPQTERAAQVALADLTGGAGRTGKTILEFADVSFALADTGSGERVLLRPLSFQMQTGNRIGIVGPNGVGKTSLLKLASGDIEPTQGKVIRGTRTVIAHFDQTRAALENDWSIYDNVAGRRNAQQAGGARVEMGEQTMDLDAYLERFLFDRPRQRTQVGVLSGGERARVALAKALRGGANLLLLDEPTNDLDIATLASLEELLIGWPGCALVVSHDRYFLNRIATSILSFEQGGEVVHYPGDYDTYRALRATQTEKPSHKPVVKQVASVPSPNSNRPKTLTYAERLELEGLLDRVSEAENAAAQLDARLADPALYAGPPELSQKVREQHQTAHAEVAKLMARWEELESRRELKR